MGEVHPHNIVTGCGLYFAGCSLCAPIKFPTKAKSTHIVHWIGIFSDELVDVPVENPLDTLYQDGVADVVQGGEKASGNSAV